MRKLAFVFIFFLSFTNISFGQKDTIRINSIFIEIGGPSGYYSLNFNRKIYFNDAFGLTLGTGFSSSILRHENSPRISIQTNIFYQKKKHAYDLGVAVTPYVWYDNSHSIKENLKKTELAIICETSYKYYLNKGKYYVGVGFTPLLYDLGEWGFTPWGVIRLGLNF